MLSDIQRRPADGAVGDALFAAVLANPVLGVAVVREDGAVLQANQRLRALMGNGGVGNGGVGNDAIDSYPALVHPDDRPLVEAWLRAPIGPLELRHRRDDGEVWRGRLTASAVSGLNAVVLLVEALPVGGRDGETRRRLEAELAEARLAAAQATLAKSRFLAAASHDLRQPLQALDLFVAVLANRSLSPENAALVGRVQESVAALEGLLSNLVEVSRLEAGLVQPAVDAFGIQPMLTRLAAEFEPVAAAAGLRLDLVTSSAQVRSDAALLDRVLRHLLTNAVRFTKSGRILLGCRRRGDALRIEIWDTGIGIAASQLELIFREFHQIANSGRDRRQGLGLGLAIVERIGHLLGHPVAVRSVPEHGSVFSIEVPLAQARPAAGRLRQLDLGLASLGASIVVIEDEPDVRESTRLLLESWGHSVTASSDCDDALRQLSSGQRTPDLIIADYRLPLGATGGQAIARIKDRLKRNIPAIILTGDAAPERLRLAGEACQLLLHKPVPAAHLQAAVAAMLGGARPQLGRG